MSVTGEGGGCSAEQLHAILDGLPLGVALLDLYGRHRYVNRRYAACLGMDAKAVMGQTLAEATGEHRALSHGPNTWEGWRTNRQGSVFLQWASLPLHDASWQIDGYLLCHRDQTDLKHSQQALAEQLAARTATETLNAAIIVSALDCVVAIDEGGLVLEFNPAAELTFGRARAEVLGQRIGDLIVPPALRQRHSDGFARYLRTGQAHMLGRRIEIDAMRATGEIFPVELTITEVALPNQRIFTAHLRDLTAAHAANAEIQRQRDSLHQSEKMAAFGSLLSSVAHELNNPLSVVIGHALMLAEEAERSAYASRALRIKAAAERCGRIVSSFLAIARQRKPQRRPSAIASIVDEALQMLSYAMESNGIDVSIEMGHSLPNIWCDPDQVQQVLSNLLINASQALQDRPAPRRISIAARTDGDWLRVDVADNGPGIADDLRSFVFDPFFTTKPVGSGTGIGLGVSRGMAESHNGSLDLQPGAANGAHFVLRLPLRECGIEASAPPIAEVTIRPAAARRCALVVDDEPEVALLLAEMLAGQGIYADIATTGAGAQDILGKQDFDLIFCDLRMPDIDGAALYDWVIQRKPHLQARLLFMTGDTLGAMGGAFLARAERPVLEKPFTCESVRKILAQLAL